MRQTNDKPWLSPRLPKGIGRIVKAFAVGLTAGLVAGIFAHQAGAQTLTTSKPEPPSSTSQPAPDDGAMTPS
jgi:hypothetical protein